MAFILLIEQRASQDGKVKCAAQGLVAVSLSSGQKIQDVWRLDKCGGR